MASISTWYHNQYSTWNRTRRMQASPFLARTDTHTSRTATAMARTATQDAIVINMGIVDDNTNKKEKKQETLFGPNIGVVNTAPQWAQSMGKQAAADNLSSDIIKSWISKSKEASQPTTTLQALVNLKRPTLRLVPLTMSPGDDPEHTDSHHHHGLEFEYDCDAPKCRINVHVILPDGHPLSETVDNRGFSRILVFESVVDGGFGKVLQLEEGATLELGRFEQTPRPEESSAPQEKTALETTADGTETSSSNNGRNDRARKRFTTFNFRKRSTDRAASGPALAVVDAEVAPPSADGEKEKEVKDDMTEGVRVTIRLSALDDDGLEVATVNEQITYLHIVRLGAHTEDEEDTRPWVVKVIKREATIGPHTFHLHEIYGLSSQSTVPAQPQAVSPASTDAHTYPPTSPAPAPVHEDEPSSECLLCLSSPREVILLPCRHLVACKECAINMVEFGAGGNIVHAEDTAAANGGTEAAEGGATAAAATEAPAAPSVVPPNPRRKRKAKGWFCPVCRQPYTSLLRISTVPPTKDISDDENRASASIDEADQEGGSDHEQEENNPSDPLSATAPAAGGMMSTLRSSFRRNLALSPSRNESETLPRDVERGTEVPTTVV
ncbi:hypothetical protein HYDPIDRAFT_118626 [Hydnomerulius pinastri MD-312]|uniref:RING-type domain-containing protein n=1 Tax=Hydnomerulius pinastri MD-312 TaxID=994086 RepID=A0A0C9W0J1_9AGAM|nr:hypothetical protein HYDPIDRAFT_118626 [Hydnomerulius pinastri MD-312]